MLTRALALGAALLCMSCSNSSSDTAGTVDLNDCQAAKAAFDSYSMGLTDPDADDAKALAWEGVDDCTKGHPDQGVQKIAHAMGMMSDGVRSGRR
jgi:hypothetical protein